MKTRNTSFARLGERAAARTVTLNSATKSFNIPGLRTAAMNFGTQALLDRFSARFPSRVLGAVNALGIHATVAAWDESDPWLAALVTHLTVMRERLAERLATELPTIRFHKPQATYLAWLDCTDLGIKGTAFDFFHDEARVAFSAGENFSPGAEKFVRLNFATSADILDEIVDRMAEAVRANRR